MFGEAWQFAKAVYVYWGLVWFGVAASLAWWAYHKWSKGVAMPNWLFAVVISASILMACFLAWRAERTTAADALAKVDEISKPRLALEIQEFNIARYPPTSSQALITLQARLKNTGAQTIAEDFRLKVTLANGNEIATEPLYYESMTLFDVVGSAREFNGSEHLPTKTSSTPVQRNSSISGVVWFGLIVPPDAVLDGAKATLSCADVFGNVSSASAPIPMAVSNKQPGYYPGIKYKFVTPQEPQSPPATRDDQKPPQP